MGIMHNFILAEITKHESWPTFTNMSFMDASKEICGFEDNHFPTEFSDNEHVDLNELVKDFKIFTQKWERNGW